MPKYNNSPLTEVVAEFYFQGSDWDLVIPGMLYEKLKETFPTRGMPRPAFIPNAQDLAPMMRTDRVFFSSKDERQLVQVGPNLLVVNNVKQYSQWEDFLPLVKSVFDTYSTVVPNWRLARMGLQYVNTLKLPAINGRIDLEEFLEFRTYTGPNLPKDHGPFAMNVQYQFQNSKESAVVVQLGNGKFENGEEYNIILDIKAVTLNNGTIDEKSIELWMNEAHENISKIFEGCLSEKLRSLFGEVNASN